MENPQNLEKQLYQFRYTKEQLEMFQGQFEIFSASLGNLITTKITLENIKEGVKQDDEVLIPIGGIVSIKTSIKNTENVLLHVSQDTVIEKSVDGSIEFIEKLITQHNERLQFLRERIQNLNLTLQGMSQSIQKGYSQ